MKKIFQIAWNLIQTEFSDRSTLIFVVVLPIVFTFIIGAGLGGSQQIDPDVDSRFPVVIVDEDRSLYSEILGDVIASSEVIRPVFRESHEAARLLQEGQVSALLKIPAGFKAAIDDQLPVQLGLEKNPERSMSFAIEEGVRASTALISSAAQVAHTSTETAEGIRPFSDPNEKQAYFERSLAMALDLLQNPPVVVETTQSSQVTIQIAQGFNQSSPGQLVTWTMITLLGASQVFVVERLRGTLRRLLISPTSKSTIISGKILGMLSIGLLQMLILIGFGSLVLGVNWGRSPGALVLILISFALAAVSLGVLLAAYARTTSQASWLTILFSMLLAALGGAWWPVEITPAAYQAAVKIIPTTWAMQGFNDVIIRGQGIAGILPEAGILLLFAAAFFMLGVKRLRF